MAACSPSSHGRRSRFGGVRGRIRRARSRGRQLASSSPPTTRRRLSRRPAALLRQSDPPDRIWLADDGSNDASASILAQRYALAPPPLWGLGEPSPVAPSLRWLKLEHRGKAHALNAALAHADTDVVVTVDADTLLQGGAMSAVRRAFAEDSDLVVGGGILEPRCSRGRLAFVLQELQAYEYVRNFLGRHAWSRIESLLLIPGAFAAFRRAAVETVGGFDPECWVEDYELIHRLHRYAADHGLAWRVRILGATRASTNAPAGLMPFLRQRRRWFGGFLQTQYWNRDMMGSPNPALSASLCCRSRRSTPSSRSTASRRLLSWSSFLLRGD